MIQIIRSVVIKGNKLGTSIGFPTANLSVNKELNLKNGVYAVRVFIADNEYFGIANLGYKPTINAESPLCLEVHIFDFSQDIYGVTIKVELLEFIREEKKFESITQLQEKIKQDLEIVIDNFKNKKYVY